MVAMLLCVGMSLGATAKAYVLPADFVLRLVADKRKSLRVRNLTVHMRTHLTETDKMIEERLYLKNPERLRRVRQSPDEVFVLVQNEGVAAEGTEENLKRQMGACPDLLGVLLFPMGANYDEMQERLLSAVATRGIDVSVVSLGRMGSTIFYVIGAPSYESRLSQLWVHKDTFLPGRLILMERRGSTLVQKEIRWLEYGSAITSERFPRVIEVYEDGVLVERSEVEKLYVNTKVPETLFELPYE